MIQESGWSLWLTRLFGTCRIQHPRRLKRTFGPKVQILRGQAGRAEGCRITSRLPGRESRAMCRLRRSVKLRKLFGSARRCCLATARPRREPHKCKTSVLLRRTPVKSVLPLPLCFNVSPLGLSRLGAGRAFSVVRFFQFSLCLGHLFSFECGSLPVWVEPLSGLI